MRIKVHPYVAEKICGLTKKDFKVQPFRASGPGGQHRNKVSTAVRITHVNTGISAEATDSRSQADNKVAAFRKVVGKLVKHYEARIQMTERKKNSGWAEKIRTYHEPRNKVKDHRTGVELPYDLVMNGDIDQFIVALMTKTDEDELDAGEVGNE